MIKKVHIYDLDGTIICSLHRYRTLPCGYKIDLAHWRKNEHKAMLDSLLPLAEQYKADIKNPEIFVIIATSRAMGKLDYTFITKKLGIPDYIISRRGNWDKRRAFDLKAQGIINILYMRNLLDKPKFFWEDNKEVCDKVAAAINGIGCYVPSKQGH